MIRIPILMYHSVDDSPDGACVTPAQFEKQMAYLKNSGYNSVNLNMVYDFLKGNISLPPKPLVITFDDGYRDNMENAYSVLKKYGMCATIFLPTDYIGTTNRWNSGYGVTQRHLVTWSDVRALSNDGSLSFQSHTCSHPKLSKISPEKATEEMRVSKEKLEDHLGMPCHHFAYPYGDVNEDVRNIAEEVGFHTACTTRWGHNRLGVNSLMLFRIGIRNEDMLQDFKRVMGEPSPLWKYYWLRLKSSMGVRS